MPLRLCTAPRSQIESPSLEGKSLPVPQHPQVLGFILAGGKSRRMGRDKAMLLISGESLLDRTLRLLLPLATTVTVVGSPERYARSDARVLPDDRPGLGPLGGIATALRASSSPWNLIVACDLPYLTAPFLDFLIRRAFESQADALLPETARGPEPLCAMYTRRCLPSIEAAIERNDLKVTNGLASCKLKTLPESQWKQFDSHGRLFKNMNSPADYQEARAYFEGRSVL